MSNAAYFGECVDCGVMTSVWHSGRGMICGPCAIGHMDRVDEQAGEPPSPAPTSEDVRRLQDALREVDLMLGALSGAQVVERHLGERVDELVAANMELEALRAEARREQRAAEERCADLEVQLRQRDERIAFLEWSVSELEGGGR